MTGFFHSRLITGAVPQSPSPTASPILMEGSRAREKLILPCRTQPCAAEERHLQLGRAFGSSTIQPLVFKRDGEELRQRINRYFGGEKGGEPC